MKKIVSLLFVIVVFITSCSQEESFIKEGVNNSILKQKKLNGTDFKNKYPFLFKNLKKFMSSEKNISIFARDDEENNQYVINVDEIVEIIKDGKTTLTFSLSRDVEYNMVENLVVLIDENGNISSKIIEYNLTEQDKINIELKNPILLDNKVQFKSFTDFKMLENYLSTPTGMSLSDCIDIRIIGNDVCPSGQHDLHQMNGGECTYVNNGTYTPSPEIIIQVIVNADCITESGGGTTVVPPVDGSTPYSWYPTGGNNGMTYGGYPILIGSNGEIIEPINPIDPSESLDPDFNFPTKPLLPLNREIKPCDLLNLLINPSQGNLKPDIDWLKSKAGLSIEYGVEVESRANFDGNGYNFPTNRVQSSNQYNISLDVDGYIIGGMHCHPKDSYPIPSFGDVKWLSDCFNKASNTRKPYVFSVIVTKDNNGNFNIYSLFVNDINKLTTEIDSVWNNPKYQNYNNPADKLKAIHNDQIKKFKSSNGNLEKSFLEQFANFGIDFYKANNETLTSWSKLLLNPSNPNQTNVEYQPCN